MSKNGQPTKQPNPRQNSSDGRGTSDRSFRRAFGWGDLDPQDIGEWVTRLCDSGYGVVLGRTSDKGALSITVLDNDERIREWPASKDHFHTFANWCKDVLTDGTPNPASK